jgi:hypothetical protein
MRDGQTDNPFIMTLQHDRAVVTVANRLAGNYSGQRRQPFT